MAGASPLSRDLDTVKRLEDYAAGPDVHVPVIASLNGTTEESWLKFASTSRRPAQMHWNSTWTRS